MANMSGKVSEVKYMGRGGNVAGRREVRNVARQIARRAFIKAVRAEERTAVAAALAEMSGPVAGPEIGEDHDAHVIAEAVYYRELPWCHDPDNCDCFEDY